MLRSRRLRGQLATVFARSPYPDEAATLRRAVLMVDSDLPHDHELLAVAALSASRMVDLPLTDRLARASLAAGGGYVPLLTLAMTESFTSRAEQADAHLRQLYDLAPTDQERLQVAAARAANLLWPGQRPDLAEAVVREATADLASDSAQPMLLGVGSAILACTGRARPAVRQARAALRIAGLPGELALVATYGLVGACGVLGETDAIADAADAGYAVAGSSPEAGFLQFGLAHLQVHGLRLAGRIDAAESVARRLQAVSAEMAGPSEPFATSLIGHAALARGRLRTGQRLLETALATLPPDESSGFRYFSAVHLAEAYALQGRHGAAREVLTEIVARPHPAFVFMGPVVLLAEGWVAAAEGALSAARNRAREAAALAAELDQPASEVFVWHTAVGWGDLDGADRLARLTGQVGGPRAGLALRQATALAGADADALDGVAAELDLIGDGLAAANAAAQAAELHGRRGDAAAGRLSGARALGLVEACEGARTPALLAFAKPLPLTERQREVVALAANGYSNREIADRLVVSVRTVEGHLYQATARLGVSNRSELAAALATEGPRVE